jgi:hypothetical protein
MRSLGSLSRWAGIDWIVVAVNADGSTTSVPAHPRQYDEDAVARTTEPAGHAIRGGGNGGGGVNTKDAFIDLGTTGVAPLYIDYKAATGKGSKGSWLTAPFGTAVRAISGGGGSGGGKTTVTNMVPPKTKEEIELIGKQNEILDIQISELKRQNEALTAVFPDQVRLLKAQTEAAVFSAEAQKELFAAAMDEVRGTPEEQEIRTLSNQRALALLKGETPPLLPGQQERIDKIFGAAREEATGELTRFGEDLATSRGMRVTDSPIGNELLRQKRTLEQNLAAGKAGAELDVGHAQQVFGESVRQFQEQLRLKGFENRLALTGRSAGGGLPVNTMAPAFASSTGSQALAGSQGLLGQLSADRLGQASQTSRSFGDPSAPGRAAVTGGVGGAASGAMLGGMYTSWSGPGMLIGAGVGALVGGLGGYYGASSATLKKNILPFDRDEYDQALDKLKATPITTWRYKWDADDRQKRTGVLLELAPDEIKEDRLRLDMVSYAGMLHAGLKAVDRRVPRMEGLPIGAKSRGAHALPVKAA